MKTRENPREKEVHKQLPAEGVSHDALTQLERELFREGLELIGGVDEAGRGPLAGPVCAAIVIFPRGVFVKGVNDSKKLTKPQREELVPQIFRQALDVGIGWADPQEIDNINILAATKLAVERAYAALRHTPQILLLDALTVPSLPVMQRPIIKGDAKCHAIAAASIVAKVARDHLMEQYEDEFPGYGFGQHKGYPTKEHYSRVASLGLTTIHRLTFFKQDLFTPPPESLRHSHTFEEMRSMILTAPTREKVASLRTLLSAYSAFLPLVEFRELNKLLATQFPEDV